jgi:hypothetical protein
MAKTSRPKMVIHNAETNEYIERDYTDEELAEHEAIQAAQVLAAEAKAKAEADKAALLARLGLTEDELQTILG